MIGGCGLGVTSDLESGEESGEDVDLNGLLSGSLCLSHTLSEVTQQLLTVLVSHRRERPPEEHHGRVDDGHAQWEGPRNLHPLHQHNPRRSHTHTHTPHTRIRALT